MRTGIIRGLLRRLSLLIYTTAVTAIHWCGDDMKIIKNASNAQALDSVNKIAQADGSVGGGEAAGVVTYVSDLPDGVEIIEQPVTITTCGECNVTTSSCVAGDWFTSDADGLAVKTEAGFALGRILANPVDGLALCVVGAVIL